MRSFSRLLVAGLLALFNLQALALEPFTAHYRATYLGHSANAVMSLEAVGSTQWRYSLKLKNVLVEFNYSTLFDEQGPQLRPLNSVVASSLPFRRRRVEGHYDWSHQQATWSGDAKPQRRGPVALQPGDVDGALINLAIVRDVASGKPLNYRLVEGGRARERHYQIIAQETLTIDGKTLQTTKVRRLDGDKEELAWIAPNLPFPVRLLQREKGEDVQDLLLVSSQSGS